MTPREVEEMQAAAVRYSEAVRLTRDFPTCTACVETDYCVGYKDGQRTAARVVTEEQIYDAVQAFKAHMAAPFRRRSRRGEKMPDTNRLDPYQPNSNMFGIVPCPKCGSECRWPQNGTGLIICDNCGFNEPRSDD